jgi:hypothetical protein
MVGATTRPCPSSGASSTVPTPGSTSAISRAPTPVGARGKGNVCCGVCRERDKRELAREWFVHHLRAYGNVERAASVRVTSNSCLSSFVGPLLFLPPAPSKVGVVLLSTITSAHACVRFPYQVLFVALGLLSVVTRRAKIPHSREL